MNRTTEIFSPFPQIGREDSERIIVKIDPKSSSSFELVSINGKPLSQVLKSGTSWDLPQNLFLKVLEGVFKREGVMDGEGAIISVTLREWGAERGSSDSSDELMEEVFPVELKPVVWIGKPTSEQENVEPVSLGEPAHTRRLSVDDMIQKKRENQERRLSCSEIEVDEIRDVSEARAQSEQSVTGVDYDGEAAEESAGAKDTLNQREEYIANRTRMDGMVAYFQGLADFAESVGLQSADLSECYVRAGGASKVPSLLEVSKDEVAQAFIESRQDGCTQQ